MGSSQHPSSSYLPSSPSATSSFLDSPSNLCPTPSFRPSALLPLTAVPPSGTGLGRGCQELSPTSQGPPLCHFSPREIRDSKLLISAIGADISNSPSKAPLVPLWGVWQAPHLQSTPFSPTSSS
ncbi:glycine N-acyltransferase-like protein 3-like [Platysternon megacephalum]|uniref:Glycine N-acyltransferase-like protein 3-like n=1 Tax=Platysternon megacephalum TaxID=55544 RepID=A0A4D9DN48_9SAUR|nr:glycine N-acyltransferase-like protein 3-like [Platysternon megacephalum]